MSSITHLTIVGGGPVGLITAIFFLSSFNGQNTRRVKLYEKRKEFTRRQLISISFDAWALIPAAVIYELLRRKQVCGRTHLEMYCDINFSYYYRSPLTVEISVFQTVLLEYLQRNFDGRRFSVTHEEASLSTMNHEDFSDIIVVSDGGAENSLSSQLLVHGNHRVPYVEKNVGYGATVTILHEPNVPLTPNNFSPLHSVLLVPPSYYVLMLIRKEAYDKITRISTSSADRLKAFKRLPEGKVFESIKAAKELKSPSQEELSVFPINFKVAKRFFVETGTYPKRKQFYLIGDAAFKTHPLRGLGVTAGILCAHRFVDLINTYSNLPQQYPFFVKQQLLNNWRDLSHIILDTEKIYRTCEQCNGGVSFDCIKKSHIEDSDKQRSVSALLTHSISGYIL